MRRKKIVAGVLFCTLSLLAAGCGNEVYTLTEAEQKVVTEYAAGVLMKYNAGSNMRVLTGKELAIAEEEEQKELEKEAKRQQLAAEYESQQTASQEQTVSGSNMSGGDEASIDSQPIAVIDDLGSFFAMTDFSIIYQNYEVVDSYTGTEEDLGISMDATSGNKLLVVHFGVTNNSGEVRQLDVISQDGKFHLNIGGDTVQSQFTLLLNDLSMYKGDVQAGETIDTVLIFEVTGEQAMISDMEVIVSLNGNEGSIPIQ